jgi:hypothetical protein
LKLIKKLSGLAIGLSLICASQWLHRQTQEQFLKMLHYRPIQVKIEKNISHISKDFYPEFDALYELVVTRSAIGKNKNKIAVPSIKIEINTKNQKLYIYQDQIYSCKTQSICRIASFRGIAKQKHTIVMNINAASNDLYSLNPVIEARISVTHAVKGYKVNEDLKYFSLLVTGCAITIASIIILAIEFVIQKYSHKKHP